MIHIESVNTPCLQTPKSSPWIDGPHALSPPTAPRGRVRAHPGGLDCRLMDNLEKLSAPSLPFGSSPTRPVMSFRPAPSFSNKPRSQVMFNDALQRMRQGTALQRLKEQRDETAGQAREHSTTNRMREVGLSEVEKPLTGSPRVFLSRQQPTRSNSGIARSA